MSTYALVKLCSNRKPAPPDHQTMNLGRGSTFYDTKFREISQQKITFILRKIVILFREISQTNITNFAKKIAQKFRKTCKFFGSDKSNLESHSKSNRTGIKSERNY
jgi:hypothetical protein